MMKTNTASKVIAATIVIAISLYALAQQGHSWVAVRYTDIDINSGDEREQLRICFVPVTHTIHQSRLSEEACRLGIPLHPRRMWRRAYEEPLVPAGVYVDYSYGFVISTYGLVLNLLEVARAPDMDRRATMERLMTALRTETAHDALTLAHDLLVEVDRKYDLNAVDRSM
jgi:hypothetical protein